MTEPIEPKLTDQDNAVLYGGHVEPVINEQGMSTQHVALDILLTNEFDMLLLKPGELGPEQTDPAYLMTFRGRGNNSTELQAITLICDAQMGRALMKALSAKWQEIPIELRKE